LLGLFFVCGRGVGSAEGHRGQVLLLVVHSLPLVTRLRLVTEVAQALICTNSHEWLVSEFSGRDVKTFSYASFIFKTIRSDCDYSPLIASGVNKKPLSIIMPICLLAHSMI